MVLIESVRAYYIFKLSFAQFWVKEWLNYIQQSCNACHTRNGLSVLGTKENKVIIFSGNNNDLDLFEEHSRCKRE